MERALIAAVLLGSAAFVPAAAALAQTGNAWGDPVAHSVQLVTVEPGVQLAVPLRLNRIMLNFSWFSAFSEPSDVSI